MTRLPRLRIIIDPQPNPGAWNMSVDQVLLQSAIDRGIATLRWYRWREPTVSLGYFQRDDDLAGDRRLASMPRVRRLSGGGALVHDQELTYSLTLPPHQRVVDRPTDLYGVVHRAFMVVLHVRGVQLMLRGSTTRLQHEPVLCFSRQDEHDVVLAGHKVLGSAQRRRRGAILQHGGFLLRAAMVAPEFLGVEDLSQGIDLMNLERDVGSVLAQQVAQRVGVESLTPAELESVREMAGL